MANKNGKMKPSIKKKWLEALRSDEYAQGRGALHEKTRGTDRFCCLGVLTNLYCEAKNRDFEEVAESYGLCPPKVQVWAGLCNGNPVLDDRDAVEINDKRGSSFVKIADLIEKYL